MVTGTSIANQAIRILTDVDNMMQPGADTEHSDISMALYNMHKLSPAYAVITCPVKHGNFFYISENCEAIFGYGPEYMAKHFKALSLYFSQIHPADLTDFQECIRYFGSFMREQSLEEYHKTRAVFHYRFRNAEGRYIYLQDEKATLVTTGGRNIHYSLVRNMDDDSSFTGVKVEMYTQDNRIQKLSEYKPSVSGKKLSGRETDLVRLIKKGLTTKEIAGQLRISHNTVRNIKSKMFEKYNVNNMIELLNMTG